MCEKQNINITDIEILRLHYAQTLKIIPAFEFKDDARWLSPWELMDGRPLNEYQIKMLVNYENLILGLVDDPKNRWGANAEQEVLIYEPELNQHIDADRTPGV